MNLLAFSVREPIPETISWWIVQPFMGFRECIKSRHSRGFGVDKI